MTKPIAVALALSLGLLFFGGRAVANGSGSHGMGSQEVPQTDKSSTSSKKVDKDKVKVLTFDDISFEMEKESEFEREMLTDKILDLDMQKIKLRGYIKPNSRQSGLKKFVFVRDNKECCFGPGAAIFDCILVELADKKGTEFTVRPVTIEGRFYLKEFKGPDKQVWAIYRMKDGIIR